MPSPAAVNRTEQLTWKSALVLDLPRTDAYNQESQTAILQSPPIEGGFP
jgi:hypothetical protein